jgi:single-stranded-DNA-specific exonuclease
LADLEGLSGRFRSLVPGFQRLSRSGKRTLVVTHIDADGLCSGSIVFACLMREGANVGLRTVPELEPDTIRALAAQEFDYYVFTDLASTLIDELEAALGGRYLVIDHHQLAQADYENPSVVNAWAYGYDGGKEACSSSMAFLFASAMDPSNRDLSPLALVGAYADRQDSGEGRSLTGLNRYALEDAQSAALVASSKDLLFTGRETRPLYEAIALTSTPYLPGLTGSKDAVLAALHQSGLVLKEGGSWRTLSSLSPDEKKQLTELLASFLGPSAGGSEALAGLFGEVCTLRLEDPFTPLRDAREFGTLLNACGRMGAAGTGIAVCLGDRSGALNEALKTLQVYRASINKALEGLNADPSRFDTRGHLVLVRGEGVVDERLLGPVISILASSSALKDKVVVGSASSGESALKVSSRVGDGFPGEVNLGLVMREAAEIAKGVGGGHSMAAGAKIPASMADTFSKAVLERVAS